MSKEHLQWQDPTADRAIFGLKSHKPSKPRSIASLSQAEIDDGIHMARMRLAAGGNRAEYRTVTNALRSARRQIQGGRRLVEGISIFGNRGQLRRDYNVEKLEKLLSDGEPEPTVPDKPTPPTNVFRKDGSLQSVYGRGDFKLMFGYPQENRFTEDGSLNGKGGELHE